MSASENTRLDHPDLLKSERAIVEILADEGDLPRSEIAEYFAARTDYSAETATSAGHRVKEMGLLESRPNPRNPVEHIWSLTDEGRQWVRGKGVDSL